MVAIRNHDVPGVIGRIGTILGDNAVNIANFALGRAHDTARDARSQRVPQGQALAVVQIDVPNATVANAAIEALRKVEAIASVRLVELGKL
jgi:D-3-phosphoglycerate dehydrogenase